MGILTKPRKDSLQKRKKKMIFMGKLNQNPRLEKITKKQGIEKGEFFNAMNMGRSNKDIQCV